MLPPRCPQGSISPRAKRLWNLLLMTHWRVHDDILHTPWQIAGCIAHHQVRHGMMRGRFGLSIFFPGGKSIFDGGKIQSSRNSSWNIRSSTEMSPSIRIAASSLENYSKSAQQTLSSDSAEMSPMMSAHPHVSGHQRMSMYSSRRPRENFHSLVFSDLPDHVNHFYVQQLPTAGGSLIWSGFFLWSRGEMF